MSDGSTILKRCGVPTGRAKRKRVERGAREPMRIALVCVGRLKAGPERELFQRYLSRLTESARSVGVAGVDLREIDQSRARRPEARMGLRPRCVRRRVGSSALGR